LENFGDWAVMFGGQSFQQFEEMFVGAVVCEDEENCLIGRFCGLVKIECRFSIPIFLYT